MRNTPGTYASGSFPPCAETGKSGRKKMSHLSKALTTLLRHRATTVGLAIRPDGFCHVSEALRSHDIRHLGATIDDGVHMVRCCNKQRLELRTEHSQLLVRARQGHSMSVVQDDSLLRRLSVLDSNLPEFCVHGTIYKHLPSILQLGLIIGGTRHARNHVHFTPYEPYDSRNISGMRSGSEVAIYIDLHRALRHGVPFLISSNQVILSLGIEGVIAADYILKLRDVKTGADMNLPTARNIFTASDE